MSRGSGDMPAFGGRGGGGRHRPTSLGPRDGGAGGRGGGQGRGGGRGGSGRYGGRYGGGRGRGGGRYGSDQNQGWAQRGGGGGGSSEPVDLVDHDALEEKMGFPLYAEGEERLGWLLNYNTTTVDDKETGRTMSAIGCYFVCQDGTMFRAPYVYAPYFFLQVKDGLELEVDAYLRRKYEGAIKDAQVVSKEDLDLKNHLSGLQRSLLKVSFWTDRDMAAVKSDLMPALRRNRRRQGADDAYAAAANGVAGDDCRRIKDVVDAISDMREFDVPYHVRVAIDKDIRAGHWYTIRAKSGRVEMERRPDLLQRAEPRVVAWDIETTKLPLQFPNSSYDQVFMISYMVDKQGYLIVNREVVGKDIEDFEYSPKPEYEGPFVIFNEADEAATLRRFFDHMQQVKPAIHVTYNGDFFDWPFVETRAAKHGMDMQLELGFKIKKPGDACLSRCAVHMDCLHWVNRDSYLPQGSRGLKAVCKAKLGYDPVEVDPEEMLKLAMDEPQSMASYSVSDAVATFYLYMTYIHPFIFSLSTIIPMPPDEVLRKGSGTLCEMLLMVEAYKADVICPNKHTSDPEVFYNGHLLDSQTYIGGKVEALESGVFRADLPVQFKCNPQAYQGLIDKLDSDLRYAIEVEGGMKVEDVSNYAEVRNEIRGILEDLRDTPNREEVPLIYHLDVAAMYPNIILTNRLQPSAIVTDEDCAACDFNKPGKTCLRQMEWIWKGEHFSASRTEYGTIKAQLESETFPPASDGGPPRTFWDIPHEERQKLLKERLKKYSQRVYKRVLDRPAPEVRNAGICMRENSFYVDTVLAFRDRRYEYKGLNKKWKGVLDDAKASGNPIKAAEASDMVVLFDSLQLAHKCILNSFYGYVMRKGARWYSMEMAGVVTNTGAQIIQRANALICKLGRTLELDTDGIWCALPGSFPENFKFTNGASGKDLKVSYPCVMLNVMVADHNTNEQYQTLVDKDARKYEASSRMTIEFEVDGPYKAMILPASKEENKSIKKRYAVFNFDGSLAELKGFELKRRGELKLIKVFQSEVFSQFLEGSTLEECYNAVGAVANRWLDLLDTRGTDLADEELLGYISESSVMSKALEEYDGRKSCPITTATRLGQFLGDERIKDKGLVCNYVVSRLPQGQPTSERAVPIAIFSTDPPVARAWLRKWCGDVPAGPDGVPNVRDLIDWDYYRERLGSAIQKIISIPAAMQRVANPCPRVKHPDWLHKKIRDRADTSKQMRVDTLFARQAEKRVREAEDLGDMEDFGTGKVRRLAAIGQGQEEEDAEEQHQQGGANGDDVAAAAAAADEQQGEGQENAPGAANQAAEQRSAPAGTSARCCPDMHEDYSGWLQHSKDRWRAARIERRRRNKEAQRQQRQYPAGPGGANGDGGGGGGNKVGPGHQLQLQPRTGLAAMLHERDAAATSAPWQILQLAPTHTPGLFKAWVMVGSLMYGVQVRVPRHLYINTSLPPTSPEVASWGPKVNRVLYGGQPAQFLYQLTMDESEFRSRHGELALEMSHPSVRGVYEGRLPLQLDLQLHAGCCAVVAPQARSKGMGDVFDQQDLQFRTTAEVPYLVGDGPEGIGCLRHIVVYVSKDGGSMGRGLAAAYVPASKKLLLVLVSPAAGTSHEVGAMLADKLWAEAHSNNQQQQPGRANGDEQAVPQAEFDIQYVRTMDAAERLLQSCLVSARDAGRGATLVLLQAPGGPSRWRQRLAALHDFPVASIASTSADSAYPALGWQQRAARTAMQRVASATPWLQDRIGVAAYVHLPLACVGNDWVVDAADCLYARCLRDAGCLLWVTDNGVSPLASEGDPSALQEPLLPSEETTTEVCMPGAYRCVCVQLRLRHLAVNAIQQAGLLADLEGSGTMGDDAHGVGPAFKVLRGLVHNWVVGATQHSCEYSELLLQNLYRWLSSPASRLFHRPLQQHVVRLMNKALLQLVAELRRLGATVVLADCSRIILCTGKRNLTAAVGYTDYLLEALKRRELFGWLDLQAEVFWHTLLFADPYNFAGVHAPLPEQLQEALSQGPGSLSQAMGGAWGEEEGGGQAEADSLQAALESPSLHFQWNMRDYLPPAVQEHFMVAVNQFMLFPWQNAMSSVVAAASQGGSQAVADAKGASEAQTMWLRQNLEKHFEPWLLRTAREVHRLVGAHDPDESHHFPLLPGSHLTEAELGSPALALVRSVCHVFSLDPLVEEQSSVLRRNLLRLLHCPEFSPASEWRDPCASFVLRDVICEYCNDCRDLDLCRDADLMAHRWTCVHCKHGYNLAEVEARLVRIAGRLERSYQLQDLRCTRCRQVTASHLKAQCEMCSGPLHNTMPALELASRLRVFRSIALYHSFNLLLHTVNWLLAGTGKAAD